MGLYEVLISELSHKKKDGFGYSNYLPWSDKVPDWVRQEKEREAVRNKGKAASNTDIIRLRCRFCYTSLFFYAYQITKVVWSFSGTTKNYMLDYDGNKTNANTLDDNSSLSVTVK